MQGGGYNFVPEKMFSGIKSDFFPSFARFQGVAMTHSLLERKFL